MTLRRGNPKLPWGAGGGGVYGRSNNSPGRTLLLGAVGAAAVVLAAFFLFQLCSGGGCDREYCATSKDVPAPDGFERVSKVYAFNADKGQVGAGKNLIVSVSLSEKVEDTGTLSVYRYIEESKTWEPLASAELEAGGESVSATLPEAPAEIAVLRRLSAAGQVVAYLPKGQNLHPSAAGKVTVVQTLDFVPAADGGLVGDPTAVSGEKYEQYPAITANAANGGNAIVTSILSSGETRTNHVQQIVARVQEAHLKGVNISYFDVRTDDRASFAIFINELATALHRQQKKLTVTLPAPAWSTASGSLDEGAYDWASIGKVADLVIMAPFRDQARYRVDVPKILEQLTTRVDRQKLIFMVSPYATELSSDGTVSTMTLVDAMAIATRLSVQGDKLTTESNVDVVGQNIDTREALTGMVWTDEAATVGFTYKFTTQRTVWIENFFSVGFKLEYVSRYKLGGIAVENASADPLIGDIWPALLPFISSGQPVLMRPNDEDLAPVWEVSGGQKEGGERAGRNGVLKWFTPAEPGTYTVKLTLSDGVALFESQISVNIQARTPATGTPGTTPTPAR